MPAARYGEFLSQVFIDFWLGVRHWSKPKPRKLPGVTTFAGVAVAAVLAGTAVVSPARSRGWRGPRRQPAGGGTSEDSQQKAASPWWGDRRGAEIHGDRTP